MTFDQSLNRFVDFLKEKGRSPSTVVAYKKDLKQLFDYIYKNPAIDNPAKITTEILKSYVEKLKKENNYTLKTVSRKINSIKTFSKFLLGEGVLSRNIAKEITHPTYENKPSRILTEMEYKALRDTARKHIRLYTMVELLLQTGIRIGELSRLTVADVAINSAPKHITIKAFESNPEREIELNPLASEALGNFLLVRNSRPTESEFLFHTKNGRPVLVRNIRATINKAFKKAGVENATVNDIRNTFIVFQLEAGMKTHKLAQIVGHQRISSTEKYLCLLRKKKDRVINKIQPL
ncbi:tyrosine-type recombinase/integrase [Candidatus Dojkabacteria bacterium]|nr:tyrosine-type recombinase/integrase [Candidatus Dojkabacteria bacterium]